jgi:hypothetical protein
MNQRSREVVMKTIANRLIVAIIPLIALTVVVTFSSGVARKIEHCQAAATVYSQPGPEILGSSYSAMMNTLYATSGR